MLLPNAVILFALGVFIDFIYEISLGKVVGKLCVLIDSGCKKVFCKSKEETSNKEEINKN